jgi:hypothetical protein
MMAKVELTAADGLSDYSAFTLSTEMVTAVLINSAQGNIVVWTIDGAARNIRVTDESRLIPVYEKIRDAL